MLLRFPLLAPLAIPAYAHFWLATVLIYVSSNFRDVAFASLALDLTGRPSGLANLQTIGATTNVLLLLFGGLAADRFRPHRVVLAAMLAHAAIAAGMGGLELLGRLAYWQLVLFVLVGGVAGGLFSGAFYSVIPDLLPGESLRGANALISITESLSRFLIPPIAGLTLAAAGAPPALALGAATALAAGAILSRIRIPPPEPALHPAATGILTRLREGVRAARADPAVWTIIWAGAILVPGSFGAIAVGLPSLAKLTLNGGDTGLGLLYGALGAGALAGALGAGAARSLSRPGLVVILTLFGEGLALVATGFAPTLWSAAAALVLVGIFQTVRIVLANTILQSRIAPHARGRALSVAVLAAVAPQIAVLAGAGYVGDAFGPPTIMRLGGALVLIGAALIASQRAVRSLSA